MKRLTIFDVDDTIFKIDVMLKVLDDDGNVIQKLSGPQVYQMSDEEISNTKFCMLDYACSETFHQSEPIQPVVELVKQTLASDQDVLFITARHGIDNKDRYVEKFTFHGMHIDHEMVHFVGRWRPDARTKTSASDDKRVMFEQIARSQKYDHITIYDDSSRNLDALHQVCLDYPIGVTSYLVDDSGTPKRYYG